VVERLARILLYKQNKASACALLSTVLSQDRSVVVLSLVFVEALYASSRWRDAEAQLSMAARQDDERSAIAGWSAMVSCKLWKEAQLVRERREQIEQLVARYGGRSTTRDSSDSTVSSDAAFRPSLELESLMRTEEQHRATALKAFDRFIFQIHAVALPCLSSSLNLCLELGTALYERKLMDQAEVVWTKADALEIALTGRSGTAVERLAWIESHRLGQAVEGESEARKIQAMFRKKTKAKQIGGAEEKKEIIVQPAKLLSPRLVAHSAIQTVQ